MTFQMICCHFIKNSEYARARCAKVDNTTCKAAWNSFTPPHLSAARMKMPNSSIPAKLASLTRVSAMDLLSAHGTADALATSQILPFPDAEDE